MFEIVESKLCGAKQMCSLDQNTLCNEKLLLIWYYWILVMATGAVWFRSLTDIRFCMDTSLEMMRSGPNYWNWMFTFPRDIRYRKYNFNEPHEMEIYLTIGVKWGFIVNKCVQSNANGTQVLQWYIQFQMITTNKCKYR